MLYLLLILINFVLASIFESLCDAVSLFLNNPRKDYKENEIFLVIKIIYSRRHIQWHVARIIIIICFYSPLWAFAYTTIFLLSLAIFYHLTISIGLKSAYVWYSHLSLGFLLILTDLVKETMSRLSRIFSTSLFVRIHTSSSSTLPHILLITFLSKIFKLLVDLAESSHALLVQRKNMFTCKYAILQFVNYGCITATFIFVMFFVLLYYLFIFNLTGI